MVIGFKNPDWSTIKYLDGKYNLQLKQVHNSAVKEHQLFRNDNLSQINVKRFTLSSIALFSTSLYHLLLTLANQNQLKITVNVCSFRTTS